MNTCRHNLLGKFTSKVFLSGVILLCAEVSTQGAPPVLSSPRSIDAVAIGCAGLVAAIATLRDPNTPPPVVVHSKEAAMVHLFELSRLVRFRVEASTHGPIDRDTLAQTFYEVVPSLKVLPRYPQLAADITSLFGSYVKAAIAAKEKSSRIATGDLNRQVLQVRILIAMVAQDFPEAKQKLDESLALLNQEFPQ